MEEEFFGCTLNSRQRISSTLVILIVTVPMVVVMVVLAALVAANGFREGDFAGLILIEAALMLSLLGIVVFLIVLYRFAPKGYLVGPEGIAIVRRNGRKVILPAQGITSVEPIKRDYIRKGFFRTFGVGGYFGSWGYFSCIKLQSFRGYWTNDNLVVVHTAQEGPFVVSPDAREHFVARANQLLARENSR